MVMISIKADTKLVTQGLQDLKKTPPEIGRRKMLDMANRITRRMEEYPVARNEKEAKRRTGKLYRSWQVKKLEGGYQVSSDARGKNGKSYSHYVVGNAYGTGQAWMHKGRWQLFRDVVDDEVQKMPTEIAGAVRMVARRDGFEVKG
jgi:hypothetical protein